MRRSRVQEGERGFALIAMVVAIFVVLLMLGVAAPRVAKELRRDREVEAMHRGEQYVRAVRVFYRKNGNHYPGSIEQLEKTNNVRFLRQKYVDPMTGKADWRIIHVGEAKTTVKGFFGQPLAGIATQSLGSAAGQASAGIGLAGAGGITAGGSPAGSGLGTTSGPGASSGFGSSTSGAASSGFGASPSGFGASPGGAGSASSGVGSTGAATGTGSSIGATAGSTDAVGTAGPFVGVGSLATGDSILDLNDQTTYETWEFIYDPRIEQLYAKGNLMGGGAGTGSGGLGSASGNQSPGIGTGPAAPGSSNQPNSYNPNAPTSPNTPSSPTSPPNAPASPFGNSPIR